MRGLEALNKTDALSTDQETMDLDAFRRIVDSEISLSEFAKKFPHSIPKLTHILLTDRAEFQRVIKDDSNFHYVAEVFPRDAVIALVDILLEPDEFSRVIKRGCNLASIAKSCPSRAEALLNVILTNEAEFNRVIKSNYDLMCLAGVFSEYPRFRPSSLEGSMAYAIESTSSHDQLTTVLIEISALKDPKPDSPRNKVFACLAYEVRRIYACIDTVEGKDRAFAHAKKQADAIDHVLKDIAEYNNPNANASQQEIIEQYKEEVLVCLDQGTLLKDLYSAMLVKQRQFNALFQLIQQINALQDADPMQSALIAKFQEEAAACCARNQIGLAATFNTLREKNAEFAGLQDFIREVQQLDSSDPIEKIIIEQYKKDILRDIARLKRFSDLSYNFKRHKTDFEECHRLLKEIESLQDTDLNSARQALITQLKKEVSDEIKRTAAAPLNDILGRSSCSRYHSIIEGLFRDFTDLQKQLKEIDALYAATAQYYQKEMVTHFKRKAHEIMKASISSSEGKLFTLSAPRDSFEYFKSVTERFLLDIQKSDAESRYIASIQEAIVSAYADSAPEATSGQMLFSFLEKITVIKNEILAAQQSTTFLEFFRRQDNSKLIEAIAKAVTTRLMPLNISIAVVVNTVLTRPTATNIGLLFSKFKFTEVNPLHYVQLGQILSADETLWPTTALSKDDTRDLETTKPALVTCITSIRTPRDKQQALWQALLPCTLLGGIFNIAQGLLGMTPSLSSSGNKKTIAAELLRDIKQYGWQLQHAATAKALHDNVSLQSELQKYSPALYEKLLANGLGQSSSRSMKFAVQSSLFGNTKAGTINSEENFLNGLYLGNNDL